MEWATICTRLRGDANDQAAWDALEERVRAMARERLAGLGQELIEDAIADTCASVVLDLPSARGPETFRGFVLGKYLNVQKGVLRLASLTRGSLDQVDDLSAAPLGDPDDPRYQVLDRCLERLPTRDRRAVELRYFEEAHASRIARELSVSEVNARRIVFNGVNRLRKCAQASVGPLTAGLRG